MALSLFNNDLWGGGDFFSLLAPPTGRTGQTGMALRPMALDVVEKDNAYELKADIPGVTKNDIRVSVDGDALTISVEKSSEEKKTEGRVHRYERASTFQSRSIRMPGAADLSAIKAKYADGVLTLDVPKSSEAQPKRIAIE